jgi:hypothetical protein
MKWKSPIHAYSNENILFLSFLYIYIHTFPMTHGDVLITTSLLINLEAAKCGGLSRETEKSDVPRHSRCGLILTFIWSKAISAEHKLKFCSPPPTMMTST